MPRSYRARPPSLHCTGRGAALQNKGDTHFDNTSLMKEQTVVTDRRTYGQSNPEKFLLYLLSKCLLWHLKIYSIYNISMYVQSYTTNVTLVNQ